MRTHLTIPLAATLLAASVADAAAQAAHPSARSLSLAASYSARARGHEASFWNPANLALPEGPDWSVGLVGAKTNLANNSLSYGQMVDLYGEYLDDQEKSELLAEIRDNNPDGLFELSFDVDANVLGVSIGRMAFGGGSAGAGVAHLSPDAVELLLFGNVGEDGSGKDFSLDGSEALGWAVSSAYVSYAQPFTIPALDWLSIDFAVGATFKYVVGHGLAQMRDRNSRLTSDPLAVQFDAEVLNSTSAMSGSGWALDLGGAVQWGSLTGGIAVQNLFRNMSWDAETFELTLLSGRADFDSASSGDTTLAFSELSIEEQDRVAGFLKEADFPTRIRLGGLYRLRHHVSVSADYEEVIGGRLRTGWDRSLSVGAELRAVEFVPLRVGLATSFNSIAYTGGLGIYGGPVHVDFAIGRRGLPGGDGVVAAASISIWPGPTH